MCYNQVVMEDDVMAVDIAKIKMAIAGEMPLVITTYTLSHDMETYMGMVLSAFLTELNQKHMVQYLTYCQNELLTNAKKANTKRIYFRNKRLNIDLESDYKKGMKKFREETLSNIKHYLYLQKEAGLYVKLIIQLKDNNICIEVHNNSQLTYFEYKRIHDKISRAQQYKVVPNRMHEILDNSEGAGLGLIIMILMLKKIGASEDQFQISCEDGITKTKITVPLSQEFQKDMLVVSQELEETVNNLPQLPENIVRVNKIISDSNVDIVTIASEISKDVSLSAEILKLANSPMYSQSQNCKNIVDAMKLVGVRGIKNMISYIGAIQTLSSSFDAEALWNHSYKVAFYAYNLTKNYFENQSFLPEDAYTCGLLHDMGKIIFEGMNPTSMKNLREVCIKKGVEGNVFEQLLSGVNHSELGARIAEKWDFPKNIVNVIRYHHSPESAPEEVKNLTCIVYFADFMAYYESGKVDFYQISKEVLQMFNFTSEVQLKKLIEKLEEGCIH